MTEAELEARAFQRHPTERRPREVERWMAARAALLGLVLAVAAYLLAILFPL